MSNDPALLAFPDADHCGSHAAALVRWQAAARAVDAAAVLGPARSLGVIVPHPDDEALGCGGLIVAALERGLAVTITILTDGAASHPGSADWPPARLARLRRHEARAAAARLGNVRLVFADAPDGQLGDHHGTGLLVPPADLFVTCWRGDPHPDHRAAWFIARAVADRWNAPLLAFPLWVLTTPAAVPDLPLLRLDITPHLPRKRAALAEHRSQLGDVVADVRGFVLDDDLQLLFVRCDEMFIDCSPAAVRSNYS